MFKKLWKGIVDAVKRVTLRFRRALTRTPATELPAPPKVLTGEVSDPAIDDADQAEFVVHGVENQLGEVIDATWSPVSDLDSETKPAAHQNTDPVGQHSAEVELEAGSVVFEDEELESVPEPVDEAEDDEAAESADIDAELVVDLEPATEAETDLPLVSANEVEEEFQVQAVPVADRGLEQSLDTESADESGLVDTSDEISEFDGQDSQVAETATLLEADLEPIVGEILEDSLGAEDELVSDFEPDDLDNATSVIEVAADNVETPVTPEDEELTAYKLSDTPIELEADAELVEEGDDSYALKTSAQSDPVAQSDEEREDSKELEVVSEHGSEGETHPNPVLDANPEMAPESADPAEQEQEQEQELLGEEDIDEALLGLDEAFDAEEPDGAVATSAQASSDPEPIEEANIAPGEEPVTDETVAAFKGAMRDFLVSFSGNEPETEDDTSEHDSSSTDIPTPDLSIVSKTETVESSGSDSAESDDLESVAADSGLGSQESEHGIADLNVGEINDAESDDGSLQLEPSELLLEESSRASEDNHEDESVAEHEEQPEPPEDEAQAEAKLESAQPTQPEPEPEPEPVAPLSTLVFDVPSDYVPGAESMHELFRAPMMGFDGPLDLLLFLIRRHELDILDIPMALICREYLAYVKALEEVDIDVAAEFLFMASELIHIKSRCLLPQSEDLVDEEEGDPRNELVRRLLEYQKYKEAAESLGNRPRLNRDVFERRPEVVPYNSKDAPLKEMNVYALVQTFDHIVRRKKIKRKHHVVLDNISIRQRIEELLDLLASHKNLEFDLLLEDVNTRIELIVSFLAVLEMAKMKLMRVYQSEEGDLFLQPRFDDPKEVTRRLSGLDESQYA